MSVAFRRFSNERVSFQGPLTQAPIGGEVGKSRKFCGKAEAIEMAASADTQGSSGKKVDRNAGITKVTLASATNYRVFASI